MLPSLQSLVSSTTPSTLVIPGGRSKADLLGFYDPSLGLALEAPGGGNTLHVRYLFRGVEHACEVRDLEGLALPDRAHRLGGELGR